MLVVYIHIHIHNLNSTLAAVIAHGLVYTLCLGWLPGQAGLFLKKLSPMPYVPCWQPNSVWKAFWASRLPPFLKDSAYQALWAKLKVGERLQNWTKLPLCPICTICANLETVEHALLHCRFLTLAADTIDYCWMLPYVDGASHAVRSLPRKHSFSLPQGISHWTAKAAHWSLRNQVCCGLSVASVLQFLWSSFWLSGSECSHNLPFGSHFNH